MWTLVTMCSMKLSFLPLGLNCGYFPSWLCHFSCCRCCSSVFSPLQSRVRRQVSYWLMKRLAVSGDVTWCLNQLFTSVTRLHVFSECGPAVNLSCLWHWECVNVSGLEVLWSWKRKSVSLQECHHTVSHRCQVITPSVIHCIHTCEIRTQCPWWHHKVLIPKMCLFCFFAKLSSPKEVEEKGGFSHPIVDRIETHCGWTAMMK